MDSANGSFSGSSSAGVGASGGAIVSSGGGDVVLPGGGEKKSRGPLFAVVALAVIVVCVVVGVVMGRGGEEKPTATNWRETYALYANYLLNGDDSTSSITGNYSPMKLYAVTTAAQNGDLGYFGKLRRLWSEFYSQIEMDDGEERDEPSEKILIPETSRLADGIEFQNELMDFLTRYMAIEKWDEEKLMGVYTESGADGVYTKLDEQYSDVLGTIYAPGLEYVNAELEALKMMVKIFDEYSARGCVSGNNIDEACVNANADALAGSAEQYADAESKVNDNIVNDALGYLVENCYIINENLGGTNE